MKKEQIIKQAIEKAWSNGYNGCKRVKKWHYLIETGKLKAILFSHDFAKAFANYILMEKPEEAKHLISCYSDMFEGVRKTRVEMVKDMFLMKMVLEKEPLKYIEKFLSGA